MQCMKSWGTSDRRVFVTLGDQVLEVLNDHVQRKDSDPESGGILLGHVRGENLEILEATVPTIWDKRKRYFFGRLPFGHQLFADNRWTSSNGTVRYLGEWHSHPEDLPNPSQLDSIEWKKLASNRKDARPLLALIVGRCGLYLELVSAAGNSIRLEHIE